MSKWAQGIYEVKNTDKYVGNKKPKYRSGWELRVMMFLDENKHIIRWASESIKIPYRNPLTGKQSIYVPDFFVMYENKFHTIHAEIIEVKPKSQTSLTEARSRQDKAHAVVNQAKFAAANAYCKQQGLVFRVISEDSIFMNSTSTVKTNKSR
jgi:hypothetical protein